MNCYTAVNLLPFQITTSITEMEIQIGILSDYKLLIYRKGRNHVSVIGQKHFSLSTFTPLNTLLVKRDLQVEVLCTAKERTFNCLKELPYLFIASPKSQTFY